MSAGPAAPEFAVLAPFLLHQGKECILLTKRPAGLGCYAGQVSLPGGAREPEDRSLEETALREAHEEVGLRPEAVEIFRELGWHETALGHRVKPFAGRVHGPFAAAPDRREVERILYLPVAEVRRETFRVRGRWTDRAGRERPVYTFDLDGCEVWGLTARILHELFLGAE